MARSAAVNQQVKLVRNSALVRFLLLVFMEFCLLDILKEIIIITSCGRKEFGNSISLLLCHW